jgi:hypothetical protein
MAWENDSGAPPAPPESGGGGGAPPAPEGGGGPPRRRRRGRRGGRRHRRHREGMPGSAAGTAVDSPPADGRQSPSREPGQPEPPLEGAPSPALTSSDPTSAHRGAPRTGAASGHEMVGSPGGKRRRRRRRGRGGQQAGGVGVEKPGTPRREPVEDLEVPIAGSWRGSGLLQSILGEEKPVPASEPARAESGPPELEPLVGDLVQPVGSEEGTSERHRKRRRRKRRGGREEPSGPGLAPPPGMATRSLGSERPGSGVARAAPAAERPPAPEPAGALERPGAVGRREPEAAPVRRRRLSSARAWSFGPTHWGPRATATAEELLNPPPRKKRRRRLP